MMIEIARFNLTRPRELSKLQAFVRRVNTDVWGDGSVRLEDGWLIMECEGVPTP